MGSLNTGYRCGKKVGVYSTHLFADPLRCRSKRPEWSMERGYVDGIPYDSTMTLKGHDKDGNVLITTQPKKVVHVTVTERNVAKTLVTTAYRELPNPHIK